MSVSTAVNVVGCAPCPADVGVDRVDVAVSGVMTRVLSATTRVGGLVLYENSNASSDRQQTTDASLTERV